MLKDISSVVNRCYRRFVTTSPFRGVPPRPLVVHCGYHKAGTTWFNNVLRAVSAHFGLKYELCEPEDRSESTEIYLCNDSKIDLKTLPAYIGTHMIRDPRDLIVSGYFYHQHTKEHWAHVPRTEYGGRTYQGYLCSLDQREGVMAEIRRTSPNILRMVDWDYANPAFLEIKYEDMMAEEECYWRKVFGHYGFCEAGLDKAVDIAKSFTLSKVKGKSVVGAMNEKHIRSGESQQWVDVFTDDHKAYFHELVGDALVTLGYEKSNDW